MAQNPMTPSNSGARRRSQRVLMQVPLRLRGVDAQGQNFEEFTETLAINAHGALVLLAARVTSGSVIQMPAPSPAPAGTSRKLSSVLVASSLSVNSAVKVCLARSTCFSHSAPGLGRTEPGP